MLTILYKNVIEYDTKTGETLAIVEMNVDTVTELPGPNDLKGFTLAQGTVADIIKDGKLAKLAGDGKWYSPTGELIKG